jgi:hypothetical protein
MAIRRRAAVSNPGAFNEDKAIRIAFRHGLAALTSERKLAEDFPEDYDDKAFMDLDRQIAFFERMLKHDGLLSLATKLPDC